MNEMRERAKEHFPMVLLTLLSIVQALALELLWSYVRDADYLFIVDWTAIIAWIQILATFIGLILIWVVYASNAMCFRWVPSTSDSVYPFVIGILEFILVESLGPDDIGLWLILMAVIFGTMVRVSHQTMRRVRQDPDNEAFFRGVARATLRDFTRPIVIIGSIFLAGVYFELSGDRGTLALFAVLGTTGALLWQFTVTARVWKQSVS